MKTTGGWVMLNEVFKLCENPSCYTAEVKLWTRSGNHEGSRTVRTLFCDDCLWTCAPDSISKIVCNSVARESSVPCLFLADTLKCFGESIVTRSLNARTILVWRCVRRCSWEDGSVFLISSMG